MSKQREHAKKCIKYKKKRFKEGCRYCDGYHTFKELYQHRYILFIKLCNVLQTRDDAPVWRSKLHADGTMFEDSFIMGIYKEEGKQITYHIPIKKWEETDFIAETLDKAPEFDGHTSDDVLERIKDL